MHRLIVAAIAAAALLIATVAADTATARNLSVLNGERGFLFEWTHLEMADLISSDTIVCHVHLEGSFTARSIIKRSRALIARVTRALANECTGGTFIPGRLPWDVRYRGFSGTLPRITLFAFDTPNLFFQIENGGTRCESNTEDAHPARVTTTLAEDGAGLRKLTSIRADETTGIPLRGGIFGACGLGELIFSGTATTNVLGETAAISVALI